MRAVTSPDWWDVPGWTFLDWGPQGSLRGLAGCQVDQVVTARIHVRVHGRGQRLPMRYTYVRKFRNKNARLFSMTIGYCQTSDDDLLYGSCCPAKTYRRAVGHLAEWRDCGPV